MSRSHACIAGTQGVSHGSSTERWLLKDPEQAIAYSAEMQKLIEAGAVKEVTQENPSEEC